MKYHILISASLALFVLMASILLIDFYERRDLYIAYGVYLGPSCISIRGGREYLEFGGRIRRATCVSFDDREYAPVWPRFELGFKEAISPTFRHLVRLYDPRMEIKLVIYKVDGNLTKMARIHASEWTLGHIHRLLPRGVYLVEYYVGLPCECANGVILSKYHLIGSALISVEDDREDSVMLILSSYDYSICSYLGRPPERCVIKKIPIMPKWFASLKLCSLISIPLLATMLSYLSYRLGERRTKMGIALSVLAILSIYACKLPQSSPRALLEYATYAPDPSLTEVLARGNFTLPLGFKIIIYVNDSGEIKLVDLINKTILDLFYRFLKVKGARHVALFVEPPSELVGPIVKNGYLYKVSVEDLEKVILVVRERGYVEVFIGVEQKYNYLLKRRC